MIALIDGDIITYRSGFAVENRTTKELEPFSHCKLLIDNTIDTILKNTNSHDYIIYLTGSGNFREEIATIQPYKGNRDPTNKPQYYNDIRNYLENTYGAIIVNGQEADDALSIAQMEGLDNYDMISHGMEYPTIICTIDKDLDMVPGWHYNWVKDILYWRDAHECSRWFHTQLLTGDISDNILGIPGCGPKKADKILKGAEESGQKYICAVAREYAATYDDPESALIETGRLLWMRRSNDELWDLEYV